MKVSTFALATALQLSVGVLAANGDTSAAPYEPQCNPAVHCPSISIECIGCNPRTEDDCEIEGNDLQGLCVEPAALDYKGEVYGMEYEERCRRVVDPAWRDIKPRPRKEDYIHACREGHYTCNDGTCELAKGYPKECYKGIYNLENTDRFKCNYNNDVDLVEKLVNFYDALTADGHKYCEKNGGIRYGPLRCDRNDIILSLGSAECEPGSEPTPPSCSDNDSPIVLIGPADACTATCNVFELFNSPGCCVEESKQQICSEFIVFSPESDVSRCNEDEMGDGCDSCQQYVSNGYYYCCNKGPNPVCVNDLGLDPSGAKSQCAGNNGLKGDVCYVDSAGDTGDTPPQTSDTGFELSGVELTFQFQNAGDLEPENDCCCDVVCTCFGDPHCTSFFGDYEVSQVEKGQYLMIEEGDMFKVTGDLAEPLGVTGAHDIEMGDTTVRVEAEPCVYGEGIYINGELISDTSNIDGIDYRRTTDRPDSKDNKPYHRNKNLSQHLAVNPSFVIINNGDYHVEIKCLRFEITQGPDKGFWDRLDITIRREVTEIESTPGCCPTNENVYKEFKDRDDISGFCVRHPTEDGFYLPKGQDLTGSGARRLRAADKALLALKERALKTSTALAQSYSKLAGISLNVAETLIKENGVLAVQHLVKQLEDGCYSFASDEVFDYDPSSHCEGGLVLEAKKPTQDAWTPIRFFPEYVNYCDDKILVVFDHTKVGNKQLDSSYELRLKTCTPDPKICGESASRPCQPFGGIKDLGVSKYAYGSTLTRALKELLDFAAEECECANDPTGCILDCVYDGDCPESGTCTN